MMSSNRKLQVVVPAQKPESYRQAASRAARDAALQERAERLWPNNENYQRQWVNCIKQLRAPSSGRVGSGWVLDGAKVGWKASAV